MIITKPGTYVNSLRPRPNRCHFADDLIKCIFENENEWISPRISLKFVPKVWINNIPALVQIMARRRPGDKPLSEPMMVSLLTHICVKCSNWTQFLMLYLEQDKSEGFDSCDRPSKILLKVNSNIWFFIPYEIRLKNNRAPLLAYIKLCVLFQSHHWIQTGVTIWKLSIQVKIADFLSCVTLKFDRWPWKAIGQLFYATSNFMLHFIAIDQFKLELHTAWKQ